MTRSIPAPTPVFAGMLVLVLILGLDAGASATQPPPRSAAPLPARESLVIPASLTAFVREIRYGPLGTTAGQASLVQQAPGLFHLSVVYRLTETVRQDDWRLDIRPAFQPTLNWMPHLTPTDAHVVDQHAFRSPALIVAASNRVLAVIPDLDALRRGGSPRWYLDLNAPASLLSLGMSNTTTDGRLFFVRTPGASYPPGTLTVGCYLLVSDTAAAAGNPWRAPLDFLWSRWGRSGFERGEPLAPDLEPYVRHAYRWAFDTWAKAVWQEFTLAGVRVGAPAFIVNETQSPNYPGHVNEREFRSIWNQAWFSSLRSASGLFRFARRAADEGLMARARLTKELALSAPVRNGLFDTVIATEVQTIDIDGKPHRRSRGWEAAFWGNSNRNPVNRPPGEPRQADPRVAPYHVLDMSWTALQMLRWYEELEPDERLLAYARRYADRLLTLQDRDGFYPAWIDKESGRPLAVLRDSPETSMSVTFLLELARLTGRAEYRASALRGLDAVLREVVPAGRWEDFETYWSSSPWGDPDLVGKKVARNGLHKQCNFSMFWTADALLHAYRATGERRYLTQGERVLDEMLMTQASWQPPFMPLPVLGGFGVMNADGEWNDARQSLFAETIVQYGLALDRAEYVQRGLAALRASFVMMFCPENPRTFDLWKRRFPFFGPEDYGFTMENYGHGGTVADDGSDLGGFAIYDWGSGAGAEAWNRMIDHLGRQFVLRRQ